MLDVRAVRISPIRTSSNTRLDIALVERGLVESREKASLLISEKHILVNGSVAEKPSRQIRPHDAISVVMGNKFVSRGGLKLEGALKYLGISPVGLTVLDAGSSTGGFADCLLQFGARRVVCVDVGTNQLHEKLRSDNRVSVFEKTNIRDFVRPEDHVFDLVVADLSFTSVASLALPLVDLVADDGFLLILVKPQFEVGRNEASRARGVIRSLDLWHQALVKVASEFSSAGARLLAVTPSPIKGVKGNVEFFEYFVKKEGAGAVSHIRMIEDALSAVKFRDLEFHE